MMRGIPDDPIISCMERTGYPQWIDPDWEDEFEGTLPDNDYEEEEEEDDY